MRCVLGPPARGLGHVRLHDPSADAVARIHAGVAKMGRGHQLEREADAFASELLMPEELFRPWCWQPRPTLADVDALADRFGTSRTATARRFVELTETAAVAFAERRGRVFRRDPDSRSGLTRALVPAAPGQLFRRPGQPFR